MRRGGHPNGEALQMERELWPEEHHHLWSYTFLEKGRELS